MSYVKSLNRWRVRWRATNKQHRVFSGSQVFMEKHLAVACYARMEEQERLWRAGQVNIVETVDYAREQYAKHCKQFTKRTQGHYEYALDQFFEENGRLVLLNQFESKHISEHIYKMQDRKLSNRTINSRLTVIKSFFRYCARELGANNIAENVTMLPEDPPEVRFLTQQEYDQVLSVAWPLVKDRAIFIANTGVRATEFSALTAGRKLSANMQTLTLTGKGRKRRVIPLNRHAQAVLSRPYIYRPTSRNALERSFNRLAIRAQIPKFGPHALRHYFATTLLLRGVSIVKVSKLLGHSSVSTTERVYAHILPKDLEGTTDVL